MTRNALFVVAAAFAGCTPPSTTRSSGRGSSGDDYTPPSVSEEEGGASPSSGEILYLALGDSVSQGIGASDPDTGSFPALLAKKWRAKGCKVELKNVAVSGYTAGQVISDQLPEIASFKPTFITFQSGANDIANGVSLSEYRSNVKKILTDAKGSGARVVVLPQNEWFRSPAGPSYGENLADQRATFDSALIEETDAKGAELVDLRLIYKQQADRKEWDADGIHPTGDAYEEWAAELARVIPAPCKE